MIYIKIWQESHTSLKCNVEPKKVVAIIDKVNRWWRKGVEALGVLRIRATNLGCARIRER